ncbi:MAG: patatin-like phospholipase family protein [Chromatiales bacterium]
MIFRKREPRHKTINLALQGGGAFGAFTWGVLDRLLQDPRIQIEGVSGTSSGAMNAVAMAHGLISAGRDGARAALTQFWTDISREVPGALQQGHSLTEWHENVGADAFPPLRAYLDLARMLSPYQLNQRGLNPIRDVLERLIDFERVRAAKDIRLFISATNVRTGKVRIFTNAEITVESLLASACLPSLHHAVEIDGESYWDGGYSGNPPLYPLIFNCRRPDILVIMVQPLRRDRLPNSAEAIRHRQTELSFNTAFLREMRAIAMSREQIAQGGWFPKGVLERRLTQLKIHLIEAEEVLNKLPTGSHFNISPDFLGSLRDTGWAQGQAWLAEHYDAIGKRTTIDLSSLFG